MVKRFLPELLLSEDNDLPGMSMGSHVDISLDDDGPSLNADLQKENGDASPDGALGIEGLERLASGGSQADGFGLQESGGSGGREFPAGILDQDRETGYTHKDTVEGFKPFVFSSQGIPPGGGSGGLLQGKVHRPVSAAVLPAEDGGTVETLPFFGDDFVPAGENSGTPVSVAFPGVDRKGASSEGPAGEFRGKVKESALAIQTLLKRD
jgi:hypothetical protein